MQIVKKSIRINHTSLSVPVRRLVSESAVKAQIKEREDEGRLFMHAVSCCEDKKTSNQFSKPLIFEILVFWSHPEWPDNN